MFKRRRSYLLYSAATLLGTAALQHAFACELYIKDINTASVLHSSPLSTTEATSGNLLPLPVPAYSFTFHDIESVDQACAAQDTTDGTPDINEALLRLSVAWQTKIGQRDMLTDEFSHLFAHAKENNLSLAPYLGSILMQAQFESYQFAKATTTYQTLLASYPGFHFRPALSLLAAEINLRQRENTQAIKQLNVLLDESALPAGIAFKATILLGEALLDENLIADGQAMLLNAQAMQEDTASNPFKMADLITLYDDLGFLSVRLAQQDPTSASMHLNDAVNYEHKALALAESGGDIKQQISVRSNLAWIQNRRLNYYEAQKHYLTMLVLLKDYPDKDSEALAYQNLGHLYYRLGYYKKSLAYIDGALRRTAGNAMRVYANQRCLQARSMLALNQTLDTAQQQTVKEALTTCVNEFVNTAGKSDNAVTALVTALQARQAGLTTEYDDKTLLAQLAAELPQSNDPTIKAEGLIAYAEILAQQNNWQEAKDKLVQIEFNSELISTFIAIRARALYYQALINTDAFEEARRFAQTTHQQIVSQLQAMDTGEFAPAWRHQADNFYAAWFEQLMAENDDHARQQLFQVLFTLNEIQLNNPLPGFHQDDTQQHRLAAINQQLLTEEDERNHLLLAHNIESDLLRHAYLMAQSEHNDEAYNTNANRSLQGISYTDLQSSLAPGEQVLTYVSGSQNTGLLVVSKHDITLLKLGPAASLQTLALQALQQARSKISTAGEHLTELAQRLFPAAINGGEHVRWYVLGAPPVHSVSLTALASSLATPPGELIPIMSAFTSELMSLTTPSQWSVSVFAATHYQTADSTTAQFSALNDLPWAEVEANGIATTLSELPVSVYLNEQANASRLLTDASREADILHIAAHHIYNPQQPEFVGLVLPESANNPALSLVGLPSIQHRQYHNKLVFLSGCDTGNGREFDGVGALSIGRAFLLAGAQNVISTKWPVADRASVEFTSHFYTLLNNGLSPVQSLQQTMQYMQQHRRYNNPYYWAGYELKQRSL